MASENNSTSQTGLHPLVGKRFGRLVAVEDFVSGGIRWFTCKCDCGKTTAVRMQSLKRGLTKSCGCFRRETTSKTSKSHGMCMSKEYVSWQLMKRRCYNPCDVAYDSYGEKGIVVCEGWKNSFESFFSDLGFKREDQTIDRIDNGVGYTCGHCNECVRNGWPKNCRWATKIQQANNKTSNRVFVIDGVEDTIAGWSRRLGVKYGRAYYLFVILPLQQEKRRVRRAMMPQAKK